MGRREEQEREVLASLLLEPSSFNELPEDFHEDAFEFPEYRKLFNSVGNELKKSNALRLPDFLKLLPEQRKVIDDVTFAAMPLNGRFRSRALALLRHQPLESVTDIREAEESYRAQEKKKEFQFTLLNGSEIASMNIPQKEWLAENLLNAKSVSFLSGEEGCGKSLLAMNLAICVAIGAKRWLSYDMAQCGRVLYLNNEMAFEDFTRRFKSMSGALPVRGDISNLIVPKEVPALRECWDTLNRACEELQPRLVVIDCLYFSHDEDENDSSAMKALMRKMLSLRDTFGIAVLLVHHTKKGSRFTTMHNDQMRGSSVFGGSADSILQMRRSATDEGRRILKPTKGRHVGDSQLTCRLLSLNPETLWFKDEGEANEGDHIAVAPQTAEDKIDFKAVFGDATELSRKEIQERCRPIGYDERTVDRLIKRMLKQTKYGHYAL